MIKVGVTGVIGSGKSFFCKELESKGYKVISSDKIAIDLAENNVSLKNKLIESFGEESYFLNGDYNRNYVGDIVFNDSSKLKTLDNIFKPFLLEEFKRIEIECNENILFFESALIFEHSLESMFDVIICTYAPLPILFKRLKERNGYDYEDTNKRLNRQYGQSDKMFRSDICINTESISYLLTLESMIQSLVKNNE